MWQSISLVFSDIKGDYGLWCWETPSFFLLLPLSCSFCTMPTKFLRLLRSFCCSVDQVFSWFSLSLTCSFCTMSTKFSHCSLCRLRALFVRVETLLKLWTDPLSCMDESVLDLYYLCVLYNLIEHFLPLMRKTSAQLISCVQTLALWDSFALFVAPSSKFSHYGLLRDSVSHSRALFVRRGYSSQALSEQLFSLWLATRFCLSLSCSFCTMWRL